KVANVLGVDLIERAVPPTVVRAAIHQPIPGLGIRETLVADGAVALHLGGGKQWDDHECARSGAFPDGNHAKTPLRDSERTVPPNAFLSAATRLLVGSSIAEATGTTSPEKSAVRTAAFLCETRGNNPRRL